MSTMLAWTSLLAAADVAGLASPVAHLSHSRRRSSSRKARASRPPAPTHPAPGRRFLAAAGPSAKGGPTHPNHTTDGASYWTQFRPLSEAQIAPVGRFRSHPHVVPLGTPKAGLSANSRYFPGPSTKGSGSVGWRSGSVGVVSGLTGGLPGRSV